jgi:hypothetical protein
MTDALPSQRADQTPLSEADQQAFFEAVLACAHVAEASTRLTERWIDVAGVLIRLIFAGETLEAQLYPALAHLAVEPVGKADATFHIWDSSSGVYIPPAPCGPDGYTDRGDLWGLSSERYRSAFQGGEYSLSVMDIVTGEGVFWTPEPEALPYWAKASPFRGLFHWLMESHGKQLLHAACVATEEGGVLIVGRGGVGKSSTALACLEAGFDYLGDDYVVVGPDPEPMAYSLYSAAKLASDQTARFPKLARLVSHAAADAGQKAVLSLHPTLSRKLRRSAPLRAVLTPRFSDDGSTRFEAATRAALYRAAAFTTVSQLPHAGAKTHDLIRRLVDAVAGQTLVLGPDLAEVAESLWNFLQNPTGALVDPASRGSTEAPLLSVIIPVHNGARFLGEVVESALAQAYPRMEIIVVDDGSTVEVELAVRALPVDVRYVRQVHAGAAAARNRGFREAAGALICFQDVDDLWVEGALDALTARLADDAAIDVVHGYGQIFSRDAAGAVRHISHPGETYPWYIGAAVFRRSALERAGLFDEGLRYSEDTDWFTRARETGLRLERLEQTTLLVRRHDDNATRGRSLVEVNALRVLKKALDRRRADASESPQTKA